jgi:hypothetical protein
MDNGVIKQILVEAGVYSFALAMAGSEAELIQLFLEDFDELINRCQQ